ncbi:hypothetical protein Hamer_G008785 [Homarus americanus]|uniref:Uncharacterized protein n=1 Tax=Homarus americanus TaxID=6706 RepID=A0A8J5JJ37_HOMAM|nr:hypothetical protein Hamer_G008785 [Homarus americanus]
MMTDNTHSGGKEGVMPYPALPRPATPLPSPRHRPHPWPSSQTYARDTKIMYTVPLTPPPHGTHGALATAAGV